MFATDLETIHRSVIAAFPRLSVQNQRLGLTLYRLLLDDQVVRVEQLASVLNLPTREVVSRLDDAAMRCQTLYDEHRRIVGFGGLSTRQTIHRIEIAGVERFTWCAWDGLFIPQLMNVHPALIESQCPMTGAVIRVTVTTDGVSNSTNDPVMSFTLPDPKQCSASTEQSISCFCDRVRFLESAQAGAAWINGRADSCLLTLGDAFELGQHYNMARFGAVLEMVAGVQTYVVDQET